MQSVIKRLTVLCCAATLLCVLSGCAQKIALFNGQNLEGWQPVLAKADADPADIWSVQDGVLRCEGNINGYIRTKKEYSNYMLHLEWRWADKPTNSGVLLHINGADKIWPLCVEAQLMHKNAGDLVTIQDGSNITVNGEKHFPIGGKVYKIISKKGDSSEKPPGQWNSYDIVCKDDSIQLTVNGVLQHTATKSSLTAGTIGLQSEGSPIEFRNITLKPIK